MSESRYHKYVIELEENPKGIRFSRLVQICTDVFGHYRTKGSHHIWKMPWAGDPRINLQADGKDAKPYQVRQVTQALKKMEGLENEKK